MCYSAHCLINDATMTRLFGIYCGRWKIFFNLVIGQFLCFARKYTYIYIYIFDEKVDFFSLASSRFENKILARRLFCSFLQRVAYGFSIHSNIFFAFLSGCRRFSARSLTFQPRVCTSPRFSPNLLPSFLPSSSSRFFSFPSPRESLNSLSTNERASFVEIEYTPPRPRVMLSVYSSR